MVASEMGFADLEVAGQRGEPPGSPGVGRQGRHTGSAAAGTSGWSHSFQA